MTFPADYNLGPAKDDLATEPQVVPLGDSEVSTPDDVDRLCNQTMKGLPMGEITALWGDISQNTLRFIKEGSPAPASVGAGNGNLFSNGTEYFGIPILGAEWRFDSYTPTTAGRICRFVNDGANIFGSVNGFSLVSPLANMAIRVIYHGNTNNLSDRDIVVKDGGSAAATLATVSLPVDARRYWHKSEGNPDTDGARTGGYVAGEMNALTPDFAGTSANGVWLFDENLDTSTINTGDDMAICGAVAYEHDGSGNWVGGAYVTPMAESSWGVAGHAGNTPSSVSQTKSYDDDNLTHWLDVTTLDRDQKIVIPVFMDVEVFTAAEVKAHYVDLMDKWDTRCRMVGRPAPSYILIHQWYNGGDVGNNEAWGQGMYDAALTHPRAGFISFYQEFSGLEPDASTAGDFRDYAIAEGFDNFNYGTLSSQDASTINWSTDGTHPTNEVAAAACAKIVADKVAAGTHDYVSGMRGRPSRGGRSRSNVTRRSIVRF